MLEDINSKYIRKDNNWFCSTCNGEIYSGKKKYSSVCSCLEKRYQHGIYINHLGQFYDLRGLKYICKKCSSNITTKRELHALTCVGIGTQKYKKSLANPELNKDFYSKVCDLGCGSEAKFFHKNGKAYCCKLGNACPIKIEKDRQKKSGIDPFYNKPHPRGMLGKIPYNKGLTKETSDIVAKASLAAKKAFELYGDQRKKIHHTEESKAKIAKYARENNYGGYKQGSGRGKKGWYKNFFCDSSWELAYVIYCLENNIDIKRNTERREYFFKGKIRGYIPDFIVNSELVEIKGYNSDEWEAKHKANPDVKTLYQNEMKPIIKYAVDKYGKDYIKLYEKK
jgi:hypothetical protein